MNINEKEKIFQKRMQEEIEIPSVVRERVQEAYRKIEEHEVVQEKPIKGMKYWAKMGAKIAGGMVAVLVAGFLVCMANPVMAKELPVVGGLFAQLQDKVSFFGNFSDRATALVDTEEGAAVSEGTYTETINSETAAETAGAENAVTGNFTEKQDGLEITFSEVYANDQALYLTMTAKSDEPFPDTQTRDLEGTKPYFSVMGATSYSFYEDEDWLVEQGELPTEGFFIDEHTYSCIMRIDLVSAKEDYTVYDKKIKEAYDSTLSELGITEEELNVDTEEGKAVYAEYERIYAEKSRECESYIRVVEIPDSFTLHMRIRKVIGYKANPDVWDSGYTEEEWNTMSDEEFREAMKEMPAEYSMYPNEHQHYWYEGNWSYDIPVTIDRTQTITQEINETNEAGIGLASVVKTPYELSVNTLYESDEANIESFMVALDANGNKLPYNESKSSCNNFAIQDRDISTVDIYILDYYQYMEGMKGEDFFNNNENKPEAEKWSTLLAANAKYHKTLHF